MSRGAAAFGLCVSARLCAGLPAFSGSAALEICEELQSFIALQRLVACPAKNRFYRANRDLGRVFKTEFLLSYLSEPQLQSRIRRGLLKVEQLHALARDVYYGRRGRIRGLNSTGATDGAHSS